MFLIWFPAYKERSERKTTIKGIYIHGKTSFSQPNGLRFILFFLCKRPSSMFVASQIDEAKTHSLRLGVSMNWARNNNMKNNDDLASSGYPYIMTTYTVHPCSKKTRALRDIKQNENRNFIGLKLFCNISSLFYSRQIQKKSIILL